MWTQYTSQADSYSGDPQPFEHPIEDKHGVTSHLAATTGVEYGTSLETRAAGSPESTYESDTAYVAAPWSSQESYYTVPTTQQNGRDTDEYTEYYNSPDSMPTYLKASDPVVMPVLSTSRNRGEAFSSLPAYPDPTYSDDSQATDSFRAPPSNRFSGYYQTVLVFSSSMRIFFKQDLKMDSGNEGDNLITEATLRRVNLTAKGVSYQIGLCGMTMLTGGSVKVTFAGALDRSGKHRYYTEEFTSVPFIAEGIDLLMNEKFLIKIYGAPGPLLIRGSRPKKLSDKEKARIAREEEQRIRRQWEIAEAQEKELQAEQKEKEEIRRRRR